MNMKKMKLLLKDRGVGKTDTCITVAGLTDDTIIICYSCKDAKSIEDRSKHMKIPVKAVGIYEYMKKKKKYRGYNIIIDEIDIVLKELLRNNILFATGTYFNIIDYRNEVE